LHELLYQSANLERIDFADYLRRLAAQLFRSHGIGDRISLHLEVEKVYVHKDAVVPCGLIVNELLSNTFKYAFTSEQEGQVRIELHKTDDGMACLVVADNGVGLPDGFDWNTSQSLGLRLVRTLARQLEAAVELTASEGTLFTITFPAAKPAGVEER
jgi:two-component sensor histidine kinase